MFAFFFYAAKWALSTVAKPQAKLTDALCSIHMAASELIRCQKGGIKTDRGIDIYYIGE